MKKLTILFLIAYWLVKWSDVTEQPFQKLTLREKEFNTAKEAREFIQKKARNQKTRDFRLYRVEERDL